MPYYFVVELDCLNATANSHLDMRIWSSNSSAANYPLDSQSGRTERYNQYTKLLKWLTEANEEHVAEMAGGTMTIHMIGVQV